MTENNFNKLVENNKNNFVVLLRNIRKSKNISQEELSKITGLTQQQISRLENANKEGPNLGTLMKYLTALNIDINYAIKKYYDN